MDERIKVAVVGLGSMGWNHARVASQTGKSQLVAVADLDSEKAANAASAFGVDAYATVEELLDKSRPEVAIIATPTSQHCDGVIAALQGDAHVLVEKPLSLNVEDADRMIAVAKDTGKQLGVGHIERYNPAVIALKTKLENDEAGAIYQVCVRRMGPFPSHVGDVGVILDFGSHDLDLLQYLLDEEVDQVTVETNNSANQTMEDMAACLIRFRSGVVGVLLESWLAPTKIRDLTLTGEKGMFVADLVAQDLSFFANGIYSDAASNFEPHDRERGLSMGVSMGNMTRFHLVHDEPLRLQLESFLDAVIEGKPYSVSGEVGQSVIKGLSKMTASAQKTA